MDIEGPKKRRIAGISTSTPSPKQSPWEVCQKCQGDGRIRQRTKAQRRKKTNPNGSKPSNASLANYKVCRDCEGSGLKRRKDDADDDKTKQRLDIGKDKWPHGGVAIIGGGIGGFALGLSCWHRGIPFVIYERDVAFSQRSQGYGLTLQQASKALKGFGMSTNLEHGVTSTKHVVFTSEGEQVGEWGLRKWQGENTNEDLTSSKGKNTKRQNIQIARQALRHNFVSALAENQVEWGYRMKGIQDKEDHVELTFSVPHQCPLEGHQLSDGTLKATRTITRTADLVVGADGIRSTVRTLMLGDDKVSSTPLRYLGCIVILGICPLDAELITKIDNSSSAKQLLDGHTLFQTADGTTRLFVMPFSSKEYMWQLSYVMEEQDAIHVAKTSSLKEAALKKCGQWHDPIPQLLQETPEHLVSGYPVYDRDLLQPEMLRNARESNKNLRRLTLLGDAAHPMSPFKGQGANQALLDALSLARNLYRHFHISSNPSLDSALDRYEDEMMKRSATKVKASANAAQFLHTEVAIQKGDVTRGAAAESRMSDPTRHESSR